MQQLPGELRLFLCGDVMLGRGVDQIQRRSCAPQLFEPYVRSALDYLELAEHAHGPLPRQVAPEYVWGDALSELERVRPHARIVNLETAVTTSDAAWADKAIHYRMHPHNVAVLEAAGIDCCALANNHVLDWGREGLLETLRVLEAAGLRTAGAGRNAAAAAEPAILPVAEGTRVLVFGLATLDCGVDRAWAAQAERPGVALLPSLSPAAAEAIAGRVRPQRRAGDVVVASIHWGGNWGYEISHAQRAFAHALIETAGVDVVHGHSAHHPKGIEVHEGRLILYGCGDFIDDYEGIRGYESFRPDLGLMFFPVLDRDGVLLRLEMVATCVRRFRVERAAAEDARWLAETLDRESRPLGSRVRLAGEASLRLEP